MQLDPVKAGLARGRAPCANICTISAISGLLIARQGMPWK